MKQPFSLKDSKKSLPNLDEHVELAPLQDMPHMFYSRPLSEMGK